MTLYSEWEFLREPKCPVGALVNGKREIDDSRQPVMEKL